MVSLSMEMWMLSPAPPPPPPHSRRVRGVSAVFDGARVDAVNLVDASGAAWQPVSGTGRSTATATLADSLAVPRTAIAVIVPVCVVPVLSAGVVFWTNVMHRLSPPTQSTARGPSGELSPGAHTQDCTATGWTPSL